MNKQRSEEVNRAAEQEISLHGIKQNGTAGRTAKVLHKVRRDVWAYFGYNLFLSCNMRRTRFAREVLFAITMM